MKRLLLAALVAGCATPAAAEIRAVFVGIDKYRYSSPNETLARFRDLSGAVRDTGTIKAALRTAYRLDLDRETPGECRSANTVSITLTDYCATKDNIVAAWKQQIGASQPGDTVVFYFAGHGSRFTEAQAFDQASQHNSTIMATDARKPGAEVSADILDREIRPIIDDATAAGVRVVTIFDSCNSGTATRSGDGESRTAPALVVARADPAAAPRRYGIYGAYRVHLAAAQDGEEALEVGGVGNRSGVFTGALAKALVDLPGASFADLAVAARSNIEATGKSRQHPHAEGALRATLGGDEVRVPLFEAVRSTAGIVIAGGSLTGVTKGSSFALYPSVSAALPGETRPLATGRVTGVEAGLAQLALDAPVADLPGRLIARETAHQFEGVVGIAVKGNDPALASSLATMPFATPSAKPQVVIVPRPGGTILEAPDGMVLGRLPPPGDPASAFLLSRALGKVARANALTPLAAGSRGEPAEFCVQNNSDDFEASFCPPAPSTGRQLALGQPAIVSAINKGAAPRFLYVLGIDQQYAVTLLLPPHGAIDQAIEGGQPLRVPDGYEITPGDPGTYRFVTIATDAPINAAALEQTSLGTLDPEACLTALAKQLCADSATRRDAAITRVTSWAVSVTPAVVR